MKLRRPRTPGSLAAAHAAACSSKLRLQRGPGVLRVNIMLCATNFSTMATDTSGSARWAHQLAEVGPADISCICLQGRAERNIICKSYYSPLGPPTDLSALASAAAPAAARSASAQAAAFSSAARRVLSRRCVRSSAAARSRSSWASPLAALTCSKAPLYMRSRPEGHLMLAYCMLGLKTELIMPYFCLKRLNSNLDYTFLSLACLSITSELVSYQRTSPVCRRRCAAAAGAPRSVKTLVAMAAAPVSRSMPGASLMRPAALALLAASLNAPCACCTQQHYCFRKKSTASRASECHTLFHHEQEHGERGEHTRFTCESSTDCRRVSGSTLGAMQDAHSQI